MPTVRRYFYYVDDEEVSEGNFYERLRDDMESDGEFNDDTFEDTLNDNYGSVDINGHSFTAAEILRATDYYDSDYDDWVDSTIENIVDNIRNGEVLVYNDTTFNISNSERNIGDKGVLFDDNTWGVKNA